MPTTYPTSRRIGPRMRALCEILRDHGGEMPSMYAVYSLLPYHGGSSTYYGSRAMHRAIRAGLIEAGAPIGGRVPVRLTPIGRFIALAR